MQIAVRWWDLSAPAVCMLLSVLIALAMRGWRQRRGFKPARWRRRTHAEWLPFLFGLAVMLVELPRVVGAPGFLVTTFDVLARAFGLTTVLLAARWFFMLCARAVLLLFRSGRTTRRDHAADSAS